MAAPLSAPRPRAGSILFALVVLCPLLWVPGSGYDGARLPIVLGLLALLLGIGGHARPTPLFWTLTALFGIHALSVAVARTPGEAVVPLLVLWAGGAAYAVARSGRVAPGFALDGLPVILSVLGLAVAAIAVVQHVYGELAVGTEGNTNYAGALAGMLFAALAGFAAAGRWRRLSLISAAAVLSMLLLSKSRGGWAGALAGTAVAAGVLAARRVPGTRVVIGAGLLALVVPLALQGGEQLSRARASAVSVRVELWKSAGRMLAAHPLLGVGAGNFAVEYPPFRSEAEFRASHEFVKAGDFVEAEDAHSAWVQTAVEAGMPGLLLFLAAAGLAARLLWLRARAALEPDRVAYLAGLGGGVAAFLVSGLFNTLTLHPSHVVLCGAFLGLLELGEESGAGRRGFALAILAAVAGWGATGLAASVARAERVFLAAMAQPPVRRAELLEKATEGHPAAWKAWFQLERSRAAMGRPAEAVAAGRETLRRRPWHLMALNNTGASAALTGKAGAAESEGLFRRAVEIAPWHAPSRYNLGSLLLQEGKTEGARTEFESALRADPGHASSVFSLGEAWALEGKVEEALARFRQANAMGFNSGLVLRQEHPELARDPRYAELYR